MTICIFSSHFLISYVTFLHEAFKEIHQIIFLKKLLKITLFWLVSEVSCTFTLNTLALTSCIRMLLVFYPQIIFYELNNLGFKFQQKFGFLFLTLLFCYLLKYCLFIAFWTGYHLSFTILSIVLFLMLFTVKPVIIMIIN